MDQHYLAIKSALYAHCLREVEGRLKAIEDSLTQIKEARNSETKSSAGDKYETSRAMMQIEEDRLNAQFLEAAAVRNSLRRIDVRAGAGVVAEGSLILTDKASYYISVGVGRVLLEGTNYFCISAQAPIAKLMLGAEAGDERSFNGRSFTIMGVY